jgi:membrane protein
MKPLTHLRPPTSRFFRFFRYLNWQVLGEVFRRAGENRLPGRSAEIAYNAIFALFPAILAMLAAIGLLNIPESSFRYMTRQLDGIMPKEAIILVQEFLRQLQMGKSQQLFSLSFVASIWVSSNVMSATMAALDQIHRIPRSRIRPFWQSKLVAIGLSLGTLLFLIAALLTIVMSEIGIRSLANHTMLADHSGWMSNSLLRLWYRLNLPIALGIVSLSLRFIYRYGMSYHRREIPVSPGALLAAILWMLLSIILRLYIEHFGDYNQVYGAIGAVIILLLWLYLSAFAVLLGSQLNVVVGEAMYRNADRASPNTIN